MRKLIFIIFSILCLTSCKTLVRQSLCERLYPLTDSISVTTNTVYVAYHDTITTPADTVSLTEWVAIPCPDMHKEVTKGGLTTTVTIKNGVLTATCKEATKQLIIDSLIAVQTKNTYEQKKSQPIVIYKTSGWFSFCEWYTILSWILLLVFVVVRARNKFSPPNTPKS